MFSEGVSNLKKVTVEKKKSEISREKITGKRRLCIADLAFHTQRVQNNRRNVAETFVEHFK